MNARAQRVRAPSALLLVQSVVDSAAAANAELEHENLGPLSWDLGFFPAQPPRLKLPWAFAAWDEAAAQLPSLYSQLSLRMRLEALPLLDARQLPTRCLQRAATVLSILSHAYRQVVFDKTTTLPDALGVPWHVVCQRLGRPSAMMTYPDLILYNWRQRSGGHSATVAEMDLLVPAVATEEERAFYLTQTEITARLGPLLQHYVAAYSAHDEGDFRGAERELEAITALVVSVTRQTLRNLTAATGRQRIDPVVWAKTVAPLAVSTSNDQPGPSGTSNPALHLLDVITGRTRFDSRLGQESMALRGVFPIHWRTLFQALELLPSLGSRLQSSEQPNLEAAWQELVVAYTGPRGLLERHRIKVYGFIEVAFKVGRAVTIGGFAGPFASKTWEEVDDALSEAKSERTQRAGHAAHSDVAPRPATAPPSPALPSPALLTTAWQSLVDVEVQCWSPRTFYSKVLGEGQPLIRALGLVFNVATMFEKHPGGPEVLRLYLGRDASQVFARVGHTQDPRVVRLLHKTLVARVVEGQRTVEVQLRQALERVLEVREAFRLESDLLHKALTRAEDPTQLPITQLPITQLPVTQLPSAQPATEQPIAQLPSNLGQWHGQDALVRLRGSLVHWALRDGVLALVHAQCGRFESEQDFHAVRRLEAVLVTLAERPLESNALIALHAALQRLMLATALAVLPVVTDSLEPLPSTEHWNACAERLLVVMGEHAATLEAYAP